MSDLDRIREAVNWFDVDPAEVGRNPYREALVDAARRFLQIAEEGEVLESFRVYDNAGDWDLEVIAVDPGRYLVVPVSLIEEDE